MCSPVVVLLGQDQNNQSAVVVLGDEEDRRDIGPGDDISAVIGERQTEYNSVSKSSIRRFVITEKAPTRAFSWLKTATTAFTFKTLLRHCAKRARTPRSLNVKLGPQGIYYEGRAAIRHYANQTAGTL